MTAFADTLRTWRKARRFSQLDLAVEAHVSSRHISFLESARAQPSRDMIARLADALTLPLDARNQMLTHAGFAARYPGRQWDDASMAPIRRAMDHMLTRHAPFPALVVDRLWRALRLNVPAQRLFGPLGITEGSSLLDLMLGDRLPPLLENWPQVAHHAAQRLRIESAAQGGVPVLDRAADHLSRVPPPREPALGPVVPAVYRLGSQRLALFATLAQFGTPEDLTLDDVRIELYFPADEATEHALNEMAASR
jgi:transcriptional regulator with XRE-family HTH domain